MTDLLTRPEPATVAHLNGQPRRRARGLRLTVLPSWPLLGQVGGAVAAGAGVWHLFGWGWTALVGGAAAVVVGMLREGGKI